MRRDRRLREVMGRNTSCPDSALGGQLLACARHPAVWLALALIANVLEGALRKWVPGFESGPGRIIAYFGKDLLLGLGVILVLSRRARHAPALVIASSWGGIALILVLFGGLVSLLQGFNAVGALLSLRALVVLPFFAFVYVSRVGRFPLVGFAVVAIFLAAINAPLALVQSGLPASHVLNKYATDELAVVAVEAGVRAAGTFAYLAGLGCAAVLGAWGGMVLLSLGREWRLRALGGFGLLVGFACGFSSGSRTDLVTLSAMLGMWAFSSVRATRVLWKSLWLVGMLSVAGLLVFPSLSERFVIMGNGVVDRFTIAGDSNAYRAFGQWEELWYAVTTDPLGTGLGTEQVGGNYAATGISGFTTYENQFPRIVAEFGVIGFLGFLVLVGATFFALQGTRGDRRFWRWNLVVTATQVTLLGQFYKNLTFNHTASALVWLLATAVLAAAPVVKARPPGSRRRAGRRPLSRAATPGEF